MKCGREMFRRKSADDAKERTFGEARFVYTLAHTLLIALLAYSLFAISSYHLNHYDQLDCSMCKFSDDLSAGNDAEPLSLIVLGFVKVVFVFAAVHFFDNPLFFSTDFRGPPYIVRIFSR